MKFVATLLSALKGGHAPKSMSVYRFQSGLYEEACMAIWDRCKDKVRSWRPFRSRKRSKSRAHGLDGESPTRSAADATPRTPTLIHSVQRSSSVTQQTGQRRRSDEPAHRQRDPCHRHRNPRLEPLSADAGPSNAITDLWGKAFSQLSEEQKQRIEKLVISGNPNGPGSPPDAADADPRGRTDADHHRPTD